MGRKLSKEEKEELQRKQEEAQRKLDEKYMKEAIRQAKKAYAIREVPIGCVIVYDGKIIGRGITGEPLTKIRWPTRSFRLSGRPAKKWMTGGLRTARCM